MYVSNIALLYSCSMALCNPTGIKSQNWFFFSLLCTNFRPNNKNPIGFKFSDVVFPCFWLFKDLIYVNLCWLDAKLSFTNIFALRFKIHGPNFIWRLLLMIYIIWFKLVTMAVSKGIKIKYLLFWWQPSWIHHLGFSNSHFSKENGAFLRSFNWPMISITSNVQLRAKLYVVSSFKMHTFFSILIQYIIGFCYLSPIVTMQILFVFSLL